MVERLDRRSQFRRLRASSTSARAGSIRVSVARPDAVGDRAVGYAIGRRVGPAVRRNRIRRRLREIVRALDRAGDLPDGWYLVNVGPSSREPSHAQLERWMRKAIDELARSVHQTSPGTPDTSVTP